MPMDEAGAARIASLARIRMPPEDLPALAQEFDSILRLVERLGEVDIENVEPMVSVAPMRLPRWPDQVEGSDQREAILANAPDAREGFIVVPKVVE